MCFTYFDIYKICNILKALIRMLNRYKELID